MTKRWLIPLFGLAIFFLLAGAAMAETYIDMGVLPGDGSVMHLSGMTTKYHKVRFSLSETKHVSIIGEDALALRKLLLYRAGGNECLATGDSTYQDSLLRIYANLEMLLPAGNYELRLQVIEHLAFSDIATEFDLRMTLTKPIYDNIEPDDTIEQAGTQALPIVRESVMCAGDTDIVGVSVSVPTSATLDLDVMLPLDFKGEPMGGDDKAGSFSPLLLQILDAEGRVQHTEKLRTALVVTNRFSFQLFLPTGTSYVSLASILPHSWGACYRLTLRDVGKITSVKLPKKLSLTRGFTYAMPVTIKPAYSSASQLTWKSSRPGIARVDANGYVTGIKNGTTTIKAVSPNGKVKASCKLTVKSNVYSKSKPKRPSKKGVYIMNKSLRYDAAGNTIAIEIFVYNRSGRKLPYWALNGAHVYLIDALADQLVLSDFVFDWKKRGSIANNRYGVLKYKLTPLAGMEKLDLRSGRYYGMIDFGDDN